MLFRSAGTLTPLEFTVGAAWWVAVISFPSGVLFGQDLSTPPASEWLPLLALLAVGGLLGHSLMNWSLTRVPLWLGSTLTLLIPIVSSLTAWAALGESLTSLQLAAMGFVVIALSVIVTSQRNPTPAPPPTAPLTSVVTDSPFGESSTTPPPTS